MLVLEREIDEELVMVVPPSSTATIIRQKIVSIRGGLKVRIGTTAPSETVIHRREIYDEIEEQKAVAATRLAGKGAGKDATATVPADSKFTADQRRG